MSLKGIMTTHPTLNLTAWGALCDQVITSLVIVLKDTNV